MYRAIDTSIYSDPKIVKLDPNSKLIFLYLITNSHAHLCGLYPITQVIISNETGLNLSQVKKSLEVLSIPLRYPFDTPSMPLIGDFLIKYDYAFNMVYVRNMLKYQGSGKNIKVCVEKHLKTLHKCPLINDLVNNYPHWNFEVIDTPSIPLRYPFEGGIPQEQDQEQYQEHDQDQDESLKTLVRDSNISTVDNFSVFWSAYPVKVAKVKCQQIWKSKKLDGLSDKIIEDVEKRKLSDGRWLSNPPYIPNPSTYLSQERWNDEIQPIAPTRTIPNERKRTKNEQFLDRLGELHTKLEREETERDPKRKVKVI
jgi:hypothetical protein